MSSLKKSKRKVAPGRENHDDVRRSSNKSQSNAQKGRSPVSPPRLCYTMTRRARRKNSTTFPKKLFQILEEAEARDEEDIVSFLPHGLSFAVHDTERFIDEVMPRHFRTCRFPSFVRQVNLYGFRRISEADGSFAYYHEDFRRDQKAKSEKLARKLPEAIPDYPPTADAEADDEDVIAAYNPKRSTRAAGSRDCNSRAGRGIDNLLGDFDEQTLLHRKNDEKRGQRQLARMRTDANRERMNQQMSRRMHQLDNVQFLRGPGAGASCHGNLLDGAAGSMGGDFLGQLFLGPVNASHDPLDLLYSSSVESQVLLPTPRRRPVLEALSAQTKAAIAAGVSPERILQRRLLLEQNAVEEERRAKLIAALHECDTKLELVLSHLQEEAARQE